jgi:hypothetical protein
MIIPPGQLVGHPRLASLAATESAAELASAFASASAAASGVEALSATKLSIEPSVVAASGFELPLVDSLPHPITAHPTARKRNHTAGRRADRNPTLGCRATLRIVDLPGDIQKGGCRARIVPPEPRQGRMPRSDVRRTKANGASIRARAESAGFTRQGWRTMAWRGRTTPIVRGEGPLRLFRLTRAVAPAPPCFSIGVLELPDEPSFVHEWRRNHPCSQVQLAASRGGRGLSQLRCDPHILVPGGRDELVQTQIPREAGPRWLRSNARRSPHPCRTVRTLRTAARTIEDY